MARNTIEQDVRAVMAEYDGENSPEGIQDHLRIVLGRRVSVYRVAEIMRKVWSEQSAKGDSQ